MTDSQILYICPRCGELIDGKQKCTRCNYVNVVPTEYHTCIIEHMIFEENPYDYDKFRRDLREEYTVNSDVFNKEIYQELIDEEQEQFKGLVEAYEDQQEKIRQYQERLKNQNIPKCPTCGSTNIEKISAGKKLTGGLLFGIFSSNVRNTFCCRNCGYKW